MMRKMIFVSALLIITILMSLGCSKTNTDEIPTSTTFQTTTTATEITTTTRDFGAAPMTQELCDAHDGRWDKCGNRCLLDNQDKEEPDCVLVCEQLCECSDSYGFSCPPGYECIIKATGEDRMGYCEAR